MIADDLLSDLNYLEPSLILLEVVDVLLEASVVEPVAGGVKGSLACTPPVKFVACLGLHYAISMEKI